MRRRGRGAGDERARDQGGKALNALNTPFAGLGERLRALPRAAPPPPAPRVEEPDLFAHALEGGGADLGRRSEEHTSELQSHHDLVCRLPLEKKKEHASTPVN